MKIDGAMCVNVLCQHCLFWWNGPMNFFLLFIFIFFFFLRMAHSLYVSLLICICCWSHTINANGTRWSHGILVDILSFVSQSHLIRYSFGWNVVCHCNESVTNELNELNESNQKECENWLHHDDFIDVEEKKFASSENGWSLASNFARQ